MSEECLLDMEAEGNCHQGKCCEWPCPHYIGKGAWGVLGTVIEMNVGDCTQWILNIPIPTIKK